MLALLDGGLNGVPNKTFAQRIVQYWCFYEKISMRSDHIAPPYDENPIFPVYETSVAGRFGASEC